MIPRRSATYRCLAEMLAPARWLAPLALPSWIDWEQLLEASAEHAVTLPLAWRLSADDRVPESLRDRLHLMLSLGRIRNEQLKSHLQMIGCLLNDADVLPMLLKGASHIATDLYPDPGMRYLSDLDLLIPEPLLLKAKARLEAAGFLSGNAAANAPDHRHLPPMQHKASLVTVELHRMPLKLEWSSIIDSEAMFRDAREITLGNASFIAPSHTHSILVTIANGQLNDGGHRRGVPWLRSLLDFAQEISVANEEIDWNEVYERFRVTDPRVLSDFVVLAEYLMHVHAPVSTDPTSASAPLSLVRALDSSPATRFLSTCGDIVRAFRRMLSNPLRVQLEALRIHRWRTQLQRFARHW